MADNSSISPLSILLLLLFLVFLTCTFSAEADDDTVFIDCGATERYTDQKEKFWLNDENFTQNGENRIVQGADSVSKELSTLRVFQSRKKNCYSIPVAGKILVRVSFLYGNYDNRNSPPTFALLFDGNEWATVVTSNSKVAVYYEAVYTVSGDVTSVCVAQTLPDQLPFISAIEVRELDNYMYNDIDFSNVALFRHLRLAMGGPSYPDDEYDRLWDPSTVPTGTGVLTSDFNASDVSVLDAIDKPPPELFLNAIGPLTSSGSLTLINNLTAIAESAAYVTMYFAELSSTDTPRTFGIFIDGKQVHDNITPKYANAVEKYAVLDTQSTVLSLEPTMGSTLPPIISAMEVFIVSPPLSGTDSKDIERLQAIRDSFEVLRDWSGDPCLPKSFIWDWVECNSESNPRITALKLAGFELSGEFPDISSMDALVRIDLSNNTLSGVIPEFFGEFPNLKELNLANNKFSGSIPASLSSNSEINLIVTGNPDLKCSGDSCTNSGNSGGRGSSGRGAVSRGESRSSKAKKFNIGVVHAIVLPIFASSLSFF